MNCQIKKWSSGHGKLTWIRKVSSVSEMLAGRIINSERIGGCSRKFCSDYLPQVFLPLHYTNCSYPILNEGSVTNFGIKYSGWAELMMLEQ